MKFLPVAVAVVAGWTTLCHSDVIAPRPFAPVTVDCGYSAQMAGDLERIIANPAQVNPTWDPILSGILGTATAQQRRNTAKTVLWTVRTRCPGF